VVDVVEGVCPQTQVIYIYILGLEKVWELLHPAINLNKFSLLNSGYHGLRSHMWKELFQCFLKLFLCADCPMQRVLWIICTWFTVSEVSIKLVQVRKHNP
jgi:hypothetical protein